MLLACCFIPENSPLTHRYAVLVYARVSLTMRSINGWSYFSPHSFAVLCLTWLEQTALYSLTLELQIGMQTVRRVPIRGNGARSYTVYIPIEFNGEFAITGSPRHPKCDVYDTGKIKFHSMLLGKGYILAVTLPPHDHSYCKAH